MLINRTNSDGFEPVLAALVQGLELEFGCSAGTALAERFLDAEAADFCWDARIRERWIGGYQTMAGDEVEFDRVAILGRLGGRWFTGLMIIDGEGRAHGMIARRDFGRRSAAERAFARGS